MIYPIDTERLNIQEIVDAMLSRGLLNVTRNPTVRAKMGLGTSALIDVGPGFGRVTTIPLTMSMMPNAKLRLDVHEFQVNLGSIAQRSGTFDVVSPTELIFTQTIRLWQSVNPATGKGTLSDESEMDQISIVGAVLNFSTFRCHWVATGPVIGNFKFYYQIRSN